MIERQNLEIGVNDLLSRTTCSGSTRRKLKQFQSRLILSVWFQSAPGRFPVRSRNPLRGRRPESLMDQLLLSQLVPDP